MVELVYNTNMPLDLIIDAVNVVLWYGATVMQYLWSWQYYLSLRTYRTVCAMHSLEGYGITNRLYCISTVRNFST